MSHPGGMGVGRSCTCMSRTFLASASCVQCQTSHLRFVGTTQCTGAGGSGMSDLERWPLNRTPRFHGRLGVDPLPRCTCRVSGKALTGPGATPFHRMVCAFRYPSPRRACSEAWAARWGGACKGPQDATAGILALLSRVWYSFQTGEVPDGSRPEAKSVPRRPRDSRVGEIASFGRPQGFRGRGSRR